jgi:hypothetical protein
MNSRSHLFAHMRANRAKRNESLDRIAKADRDACAVNDIAVSRGMRPPRPDASNYQECIEALAQWAAMGVKFLPDWKSE